VPKVFIECANMRDAADAALVTSLRWQALAARAIAAGLAAFLVPHRWLVHAKPHAKRGLSPARG